MKFVFLFTIVLLISFSCSTSLFNFLFKKERSKNNQVKIDFDPGLVIKPKIPNVKDLIMNGNFKGGKDRSPLWRNYDDRNLTRPNFDGVHDSHSWMPPLGVTTQNQFKLASPNTILPKKKGNRIIADDLPPHTMSPSAYSPVKRSNVIQIDVPISSKKTVSHVIDPRLQLPPNVQPSLHALNPVKFLQVTSQPTDTKEKKTDKKTEIHKSSQVNTEEALEAAKKVELTAKELTESVKVPNNNGKITVNVENLNNKQASS